MSFTDLSRRGFLRRFGIGVGGLGVLGAACSGASYNDKAAEYQAFKTGNTPPSTAPVAAATMDHGASSGTVIQAQGGHNGMTWEQIDKLHEAGVKAFPAKTTGLGGQPLAFTMDGEVKVFRLEASAVKWEVRPGEFKDAYGYNGTLPGPEVRVTEGDRVRFVFKNSLQESSAIHWHGLATPSGMDGVPFITQPPVKPGETFTYEFTAKPAGTHMYHSHHNAMEQVGKGLLGAFIVEPKDKSRYPAYDKEYTMVLNDTLLGFTLNGKSFPATAPLTAKVGQKILVRYMNEGLMNHPMHLHGMPMRVVAKDGYLLPNSYQCDNLDVAPGDRYEVLIEAETPGIWAFHCHTLSHAESPEGMFGLVTAIIIE
ncbi:MAG: multicopper oxidase domain-containing protein [Dehalococcoidia bacterium]